MNHAAENHSLLGVFQRVRGEVDSALSQVGEVRFVRAGGEKLVGIKILDAKEVLGSGKIPAVVLEGLESATAPLALRESPPENYGSASETGPGTR